MWHCHNGSPQGSGSPETYRDTLEYAGVARVGRHGGCQPPSSMFRVWGFGFRVSGFRDLGFRVKQAPTGLQKVKYVNW